MKKIDISQLVLPHVSPSGVQLLDLLSKEDADFKKLQLIINKDPILASSVIAYSNSPLYYRRSKITNVQTALSLLGLKNIRSAVVMAIMRSAGGKQNDIDALIWEHCQRMSILCRFIAKRSAPSLTDDMQFIGLIHDIGMLVLNKHDASRYEKLVQAAQQGEALDSLEEQTFGISHDAVTSKICEQFRFVKQVSLVIGAYHAKMDVTDASSAENGAKLKSDVDRMMCILSLAHHLESRITNVEQCFASTSPFDLNNAISLLRLDESLVSQIVDESQF